jgi:hypothetical protein
MGLVRSPPTGRRISSPTALLRPWGGETLELDMMWDGGHHGFGVFTDSGGAVF